MAISGMNMGRVKQRNRSLILKYINDNGPVSRKEIAAAAHLTPASVTQITMQLLNEDLLTELGTAKEPVKRAGRREVLLDIRADSRIVCSVNIEPEMTTAALCDLKGEVCKGKAGERLIRRFPTQKDVQPEVFLQKAAEALKTLFSEATEALRAHVHAVSVGITGIVDAAGGRSVSAYGIWQEEVDVRRILQEATGLPVLVENNIDAFATAELLFGTGRAYDDLLVIKWGPGVGSAIVMNGEVYHGRHGKTAELGHFIVDPEGRQCSCGRRGCLETKLSYRALQDVFSGASMTFDPERFGADLLRSPETVRQQLSDDLRLFARCIVNAGALIAPNRIVLCGPLFEDEDVRQRLTEYCREYDPKYTDRRILHTALAGKESYIGPAAVCIRQILQGEE